MGIFPFWTPVENNRFKRKNKHYELFCDLKGYKKLSNHELFTGPWKGKDGIIYTDRALFVRFNGSCAYFVNNDICYGYYEVGELEKYADPLYHETDFISIKGYRKTLPMDRDYIKNIQLQRDFFIRNGWLPRWEKDGKKFDHIEILIKEGYQYTGEPDFPLILESDKITLHSIG